MCFLIAAMVFVRFIANCRGAENDVLNLGDEDFNIILKQHETTLVMFYAPWCSHCQRLKPEYAKAAGIVKNDNPPIKLAKVDCTENGKEICKNYSIHGYPTLKIFLQDEVSEVYKGPRKAADIVKYMRNVVSSMVQKQMAIFKLAKLGKLAQFLNHKDNSLFDYITGLDTNMLKVLHKKREKKGLPSKI